MLIAANVVEMFRDFLFPIAKHFREKGWRVDGMANGASRSAACAAAFDRAIDVEWSRHPFDPANFVHAPKTVARQVAEAKYDLVHAHTPTAGFVARMALRCGRRGDDPARKSRIIYTAHGFHFHPAGSLVKNCIYRTLEQVAGRWTDYLVVINRTDEAAARKHRIVPEDRIVYMPGIGVDLSYYNAAGVAPADVRGVRDELGLKAGDSLFLMLAEFIPRKRHVDALRAFSYVRKPNVRLALAGEGPLLEDMRRLASALGVADRVHFLGFRTDVPTLIRASVATLLPSEQEGLPRSIMESLCMGIPVISTNIRGCRDLLEDGAGLLVPIGNWHELGRAMTWILDHPGEAASMGEVGRRVVAAHGLEHILLLHESLYDKALAS